MPHRSAIEEEPDPPRDLGLIDNASVVGARIGHQDSIDPAKIRPWLMRVTRNGCLDRLRRRHPTEELEDWRQPDMSPGPMQGLHHHEQGEWLKASINGLKEPYRSLVVLRDVNQHSYEEVAGVLELSMSQVKVYLHRARKQLREQLSEVRP